MGYCTVSDIRTISHLNISDISDTDLNTLIGLATQSLNKRINIEIIREYVDRIDDTRENDIDGTNTTFYIRNWHDYYIGDKNNDGEVTGDDIMVYLVDPDGTETTATVSSVTPNDGKFTMSSAPASDKEIYITYVIAPVSVSDPDESAKWACAYLTAAYACTSINAKRLKGYSTGKLKVAAQSPGSDIFYNEYMKIVNDLCKKPIKKSEGKSVMESYQPGFRQYPATAGRRTEYGRI